MPLYHCDDYFGGTDEWEEDQSVGSSDYDLL